MNPGIELAKEICRVEKKLKVMVETYSYHFKIERKGQAGILYGGMCSCGHGIKAEWFQTYKAAQQEAAVRTIGREVPHSVEACSACLKEKHGHAARCPDCGHTLSPLYESMPDLARYCTYCGYKDVEEKLQAHAY